MSSNTPRVLIVEDDRKLAFTIKRRLEIEGFATKIKLVSSSTIAEDITEIRDMLRDERFDIVVLDYIFDPYPVRSTPETSGLAVLKAIRESDKYIPVIIFTGYPENIDQVSLMKAGASYVIIKGVENAIVEGIKRFLEERDKIVADLEEIVRDNPKAEEPLLLGELESYSLKEILTEIKKGSPKGRELYSLYKSGLSEILMKLKKEDKR